MQRIGSLIVLLVGIAFLLIPPIDISATGVTDTFEFDPDATMDRPQIIHVTGNIYAIIFEDDDDTSGKVITVNISSAGDITNSILNTLTFDSDSVTRPQIAAVDTDTFAIAYTEQSGNDVLKTVNIDSSGAFTGLSETEDVLYDDMDLASQVQIAKIDSDTFAFVLKGDGQGRIFTRDIDPSTRAISTPSTTPNPNFVFDSSIESSDGEPQITQIDSDTYGFVYEDASNSDGIILTIDTITSAGAITQSVKESLVFSDSMSSPQLTQIDSDTFGILYQDGSDSRPTLKTVDIAADGDIAGSGTISITNEFELDNGPGSTPQMTRVDSDTFAFVYCNTDGDVVFKTLDISGAGIIASAITESLLIDNNANNFPQILKISSTVFAVVYNDNENDGQLVTITIPEETTTAPRHSGGDTTAPTVGKSSTGKQVVENGFSYQSNLGGFTELDADLGLTHMDSLPVAVGGIPDTPPGEIRDDVREKLDERGLGDVAKTFDNLSDAIDALDNFINRPPPADAPPGDAPPEPQEISDVLDNLKKGLDQSQINPDSHPNPEQAAQINNLLDRIAQKITEIEAEI